MLIGEPIDFREMLARLREAKKSPVCNSLFRLSVSMSLCVCVCVCVCLRVCVFTCVCVCVWEITV